MTKEETIAFMRKVRRESMKGSYAEEAYDMAIEALKERPTGKWKKKLGALRCSVCGNSWSVSFEHLLNKFNYCPNCGADMRGEEFEEPNYYDPALWE